MKKNITSPKIIEQWLTGWSLSRELPLPTKYKSGFKVDVGYEHQKARYVFPSLTNDFIELSNVIEETWIHLKVCASIEEISNHISSKWVFQPQGFMMNCFEPMKRKKFSLSKDYIIQYEKYNSTYITKVITKDGEIAATGRVVLVDDLAIYDRIVTANNHQRKGLASFIMKELEKMAISKCVYKNILVATEEGKFLYQSLGWQLYSFYTSIVIAEQQNGL